MTWQPMDTLNLLNDRFNGLHTADSVIVCTPDGRVGEAYCKYGEWKFAFDADRDDPGNIITPTHWMPLPEPPFETPVGRVEHGRG